MEDPESVQKREQELKDATALVESLTQQNRELSTQMADLKTTNEEKEQMSQQKGQES